jgi:hypothetical protein
MKKLLLSGIVVAMFIFSACNTSGIKNAVEYNDTLINTFSPIIDQMIEFEMSVYDSEINKDTLYNSMKNYITQCKENLEKLPIYTDGEELKNSTVKVVEFYETIINNQYAEILALVKQDEILSPVNEAKIDSLIRDSYKNENEVYDAFEQEQKKFAVRHNFKIQETTPNKQALPF